MGFLSGLGKVMRGEPIFTTAGSTAESTVTAGTLPDTDESADHASPVIMIGRIESSISDNQTDVYGDVHNGSDEPVFLDKVLLNGSKRELDIELKPGESRQFLLYRGNKFANEPKGYAELQFRAVDGHYFSARHMMHSHQRSFGYEIVELELIMPIRKIA